MALRVQKAQLPAELRDSMIKQLGAVPEPVEVAYNNPRVALANQEFSAMVSAWDSAVGKPAGTVRQIARYAREHVAGRRPRGRVSQAEQQVVVEQFLAALHTGSCRN